MGVDEGNLLIAMGVEGYILSFNRSSISPVLPTCPFHTNSGCRNE